jgi:alpha-ribazole phosphatase
MPADPRAPSLWIWRHPRPIGAEGRCIGRTDLDVDHRRAKRLAHRVLSTARRESLPRTVWTSPLRRCAIVGRLLAAQGFEHVVDDRLAEMDFGRWDGLPWAAIAHNEVAAWEADFANHAPGGGESLAALMHRVRAFVSELPPHDALVIGHGGWINALRALGGPPPLSAQWPRPPAYASLTRYPQAGKPLSDDFRPLPRMAGVIKEL